MLSLPLAAEARLRRLRRDSRTSGLAGVGGAPGDGGRGSTTGIWATGRIFGDFGKKKSPISRVSFLDYATTSARVVSSLKTDDDDVKAASY